MGSADTFDWARLERSHPAPGDTEFLLAKATAFDTIRDEGLEIAEALRAIDRERDAIWQGQTAEAFRNTLKRLLQAIDKLGVSYQSAGEALRFYASDLASAKLTADQAARKADQALADREFALDAIASARAARAAADRLVANANDAVEAAERRGDAGPADLGAGAALIDATSERRRAQNSLSVATTQLDAASTELSDADALLAAAKLLASQAEEVVGAAAKLLDERLREAGEQGVENAGVLEKVWNETGGRVVTANADAWHWITDVGNLKELSKALGTIGEILGVLQLLFFWVPVLGPALAMASLAVAGAKLLVDSYLLAKGEASWQDFALSVVGFGLARFGAKGSVGQLKNSVRVFGAADSTGAVAIVAMHSENGVTAVGGVVRNSDSAMLASGGPRLQAFGGVEFDAVAFGKAGLEELALDRASTVAQYALAPADEKPSLGEVINPSPALTVATKVKDLVNA
jgi:uncharacterized protein YukE